MVMGHSYRERLRDQVACGECGEMLVVSSLSSNLATHHGRAAGDGNNGTHLPRGGGPLSYLMSFTTKGGTTEIPCGGVPGKSGDKDGNTVALSAQAYPRHRGDSGGRKLPQTTVRPVRHAGTLEGAEQAVPGYRTVPQGDRTEETEAGGGGDAGEFGAGV